jgi:fused signal recognition particle receptor
MGLFGKILSKFNALTGAPTALDLDELESALLAADLGPKLSKEILELSKRQRGDLTEHVEELLLTYFSSLDRGIIRGEKLTTIMVVGVNGTGKTTSVAKLAYLFKKSGEKVLLTAADTFRAAAVDQLKTWAQRIDVAINTGRDGQDPASVAFDGAKRAIDEGFALHIIDTAGRLHTQSNLMEELAKVQRVVEKVAPVNEVLLVLDGAMGQNAMAQGKEFTSSIPLTGLIVTKLDGSAKGGAALLVEKELTLPIKFIGLGESIEDLTAFEPGDFVKKLLAP